MNLINSNELLISSNNNNNNNISGQVLNITSPINNVNFDQNTSLDQKIDDIYSLASILNSRNLELNSQIILNLTKCSESLDALIQTSSWKNIVNILNNIIYDEWIELYQLNESNKFNKELKYLKEVIQCRLNARKNATQALNKILCIKLNKNELKLFSYVSLINKFNQSVIFSELNNETYKLDQSILNSLIQCINYLINYEQLLNLNENLGVYLSLSEFVEILLNLKSIQLNEQINCLLQVILNYLTKHHEKIIHRRWLFKGLIKYLKKIINQTHLIDSISKFLIQIDPVLLQTEFYLSEIFINQINLTNSKPSLKIIFEFLLNQIQKSPQISVILIEKIQLIINFLIINKDEELKDLSILLLLNSFLNIDQQINELILFSLFKILSNQLSSSNLNIVTNTCKLLTHLSIKLSDSIRQQILIEQIDLNIKTLTNSTNEQISNYSLTILQNLYSSSNFALISRSSSSSLESQSINILTNRYRKHIIEDENDFLKNLNQSDTLESLSLSSTSSFNSSSSSSTDKNNSYYLNSSDSDKSETSSSYDEFDIIKPLNLLDLDPERLKSSIKSNQINHSNVKQVKHVTFKIDKEEEDENEEIEIDAQKLNDKLKIDVNYKPESIVYMNFLNRSRRYFERKSENRESMNNQNYRSESPQTNLRFLKSNSNLLNDLNSQINKNENQNKQKKLIIGLVRPLVSAKTVIENEDGKK